MNMLLPAWQGLKRLLVDRGDGSYAERVEAYPPAKVMTDNDGPNARIRVDPGQTSFYAGRQGNSFHEFAIASSSLLVIRLTVGVNMVIKTFGAAVTASAIDLELVSNGTPAGTFDTPIPAVKTNNMTTAAEYDLQVSLDIGGTHSGGTVIQKIQFDSALSGSNRESVVIDETLPFGFAPGVYYIRIINTGNATADGIFRARWEERP